ncbi:MAG: sugar ABC transporter ATP-binding protein [Anaerolineaceae bacterium]
MTESPYKVCMRGITKHYAGVKALQSVDFDVKSGEIHALVGENGAGKSTLMGILAGSTSLDSGEIFIGGDRVNIDSPVDGVNFGISIIYQELALIGDLTVAENIYIDELRNTKNSPFINWPSLRQRAGAVIKKLGFENLDVNDRVKDLSIAYQQVVEICKAMARNSSILVLDEPTAVLASAEVEQLLVLLGELKRQGVAIVYISHRLDEIFQIADRITVLKDGKLVETLEASTINKQQLVNKMIGRTLDTYYPQRGIIDFGEEVLRVDHIRSGARVKDVSFSVRQGEIVGLSGLVGSGRTEAVKAIFGEGDFDGGEIYVDGKRVSIKNPIKAVQLKIGLLPEDRKNEGVILNLSIRNNITLGALDKFTGKFGWIHSNEEDRYLDDIVKKLTIKLADLNDPVSSLSGGNQQKVSIARLLALDSKILLLDEPTRGVDVGAKIEIFNIINTLVSQHFAVIMISSEMTEIIGMCDRVFIFREGRTVAELEKNMINEQNLIDYSMGVKENV